MFKKVVQNIFPSTSVFISLGIILIIYITTLFINNPQGFWIADDSIKFLQVKSFLDKNYTDFSLSWPGTTVDPNYEYNPIPVPFSKVTNHKLYPIFPPIFAIISTIPFKYLGYPGLYILPFLASLLMLIGAAKIARTITTDIYISHCSILLAGLCTPIWFYSVVFWEHTISIALCVWAVYFYLRYIKNQLTRDLILGSLLAVFSIYFRDDMYVFCAVLVFSTLFFIRVNRLKFLLISLGTLGCGILPLWTFQWVTISTPFGFHLTTHLFASTGIGAYFLTRFSVLYNMVIASNPNRGLSFLLTIPILAAFVLFPRVSLKIFKYAVPVYGIIGFACGSVYLAGLLQAISPIAYLLQSSNSFLIAAPFLILAFLRHSNYTKIRVDPISIRWIWTMTLAYVCLYCLVAPQLGSNGIHWGNRFLLLAYPLLTILAAINIVQWIRLTPRSHILGGLLVVFIVLVSFGAQIKSIDLLHKKKDFSYRLNQMASKRIPQVPIITYLPWVPSDLVEIFDRRMIFLPKSQQQMYDLLAKLTENNYSQFIFIENYTDRTTNFPLFVVKDEGLNFFSLKFTQYTIPKNKP